MQQKDYATAELDTEKTHKKGNLSPAFTLIASDLTAIMAGIHRECAESGEELLNLEVHWTRNPKDSATGRFIVRAKKGDRPRIIRA